MPRYPEDYPENCPPIVGDHFPEKCFRLIPRSTACKRKDFLSTYDCNGHVYKDGIDKCGQRSISVFSDKTDAFNVVLQHPKIQQKYVATLKIGFEDGVFKPTPDPANGYSHLDWWVSNSFDMNNSCLKVETVVQEAQ